MNIKIRFWQSEEKKYKYVSDLNELKNCNFCLDKPEIFTGVKDKNGFDIYEGDYIVEHYDGLVGKINRLVEFCECDAGVQGSICDVPLIAFSCSGFPLTTDYNYEVVGNVNNNPELEEG